MTKQAELKAQAYASNLKSRALSILIYLIDRSNQDLTCFPAIPTMAEQLHISISTVKRALHELVDAGYIQKDSRFREKNRGQTSNLYTLVLFDAVPTPNYDNNLDHEDTIPPAAPTGTESSKPIKHISFENLKQQPQEQGAPVREEPPATPSAPEQTICTPVHTSTFAKLIPHTRPRPFIMKGRHFLSCNPLFSLWTGAGFNLQPP